MKSDRERFSPLLEEYNNYRDNYAGNIVFDPDLYNLSAKVKLRPPMLVQIYFDTATYDIIERDVKVTLEAQLGVIGGTMGLFAGFSILSGVEIIYYAVKWFMTVLNTRKAGRTSYKVEKVVVDKELRMDDLIYDVEKLKDEVNKLMADQRKHNNYNVTRNLPKNIIDAAPLAD